MRARRRRGWSCRGLCLGCGRECPRWKGLFHRRSSHLRLGWQLLHNYVQRIRLVSLSLLSIDESPIPLGEESWDCSLGEEVEEKELLTPRRSRFSTPPSNL